MNDQWSYGDFIIKEGLKPKSEHFQYFFIVSRSGEKKCRYCVWIEDDALSRFDTAKDFNSIVDSMRAEWQKWVMEKLDQSDFRDLVLRFDKAGNSEIDLMEMNERLSME
jgi:hypothetical protein